MAETATPSEAPLAPPSSGDGAAPGAGATGVPNATRVMADNHYGWFVRIRTGIYDLTEDGRAAITDRTPAQ